MHAYIVRELVSISFFYFVLSRSFRYAFVCARTRTIVSDTQNCVKKKVNMRREGVLEMGRELDDAVAAAT